MKVYFLVAAALFFSGSLSAQILKVDKAELDADSSNFFQGSVDLNYNLNNRSTSNNENTVFMGFKAQGDLVYFSKRNAYILINSIDYFSVSDGPFVSTGYAHFRINFLRKKPVSLETFTQGQYDDGRNMPARFLQGAGVKFRLIDKKNLNGYLGTGIMWEYEKWKKIAGEDGVIEKRMWKSSNYLNMKYQVNDLVDFNSTIYYQGGYDGDEEVFRSRINMDLNLDIQLTKSLSFLTTFAIQYEDKPIIPIDKYVYSLTNGLKLEF